MVPIEHVYEQIRTFAADAGARKVVLFGSRAKGVNRPKSDIDLAVAGCPDFNRLEQNLQDNLWSLLKVDVINLDEPISSSLRAEIERSGKVLYEKYENYVSALKSLRKLPNRISAMISSRAASLTSSSCSLSLVGNCSRRCWLMRETLFPLPVLREMCSKPLSNITISWTNRCGCVCCAIAMILLISTMRNAPRRLVDAIIVDYIPELSV